MQKNIVQYLLTRSQDAQLPLVITGTVSDIKFQ